MVEASRRKLSTSSFNAEEPASKRKKVEHPQGLVNVNIEEQRLREANGEVDPKPHGREVIIQFRNVEEKEVGVQISINSGSSKGDLNKILAEFLPDNKEFQLY